MSLAISVNKKWIDRSSDSYNTVAGHCQHVIEDVDAFHYVPAGGKLMTVLLLLAKYDIDYDLKSLKEKGA